MRVTVTKGALKGKVRDMGTKQAGHAIRLGYAVAEVPSISPPEESKPESARRPFRRSRSVRAEE